MAKDLAKEIGYIYIDSGAMYRAVTLYSIENGIFHGDTIDTDELKRRIGGGKMIRGYVPLSEMFGYATDLRSRTQGRGNYSMFFEKYEPVPKSVQEKVLAGKAAK